MTKTVTLTTFAKELANDLDEYLRLRANRLEKCSECGGDCNPECGKHPLGCTYGGFSKGYWLVTEGCMLEHTRDD